MNLNDLPYALEPMGVRDIPTVYAIERSVFSLPWSATAFRYELSSNAASEYLVLRYLPWVAKTPKLLLRPVRRLLQAPMHETSLLGYGGFWLMADEAHICTLALRPEWRGRGLGEMLLVALIERALGRQAKVLTLEVRKSNAVAQALYKKYGFTIIGQRKRYYSDNGEDAYIMTTESIVSPVYQRQLQRLARGLRERLLAQPKEPPARNASRTEELSSAR